MKNKLYCIAITFFTLITPLGAAAKDGDQETSGVLSHFSSSSVTVASLTCTVSSGTEYEDSNGNHIPRSRFSVGNRVRLKCRSGAAKNLKLLSGSSSSSSSNSSSSNSSGSSSSSSSSNNSDRNLRDNLSAADGIETSATGSVRFISERRGREIRLTASVKIPAQNTTPPSTTINEASNVRLKMNFIRNNRTYARCSLRFNNTSNSGGINKAEHKLDVRVERSRSRDRKGGCDVNVNRGGTQKGVPSVRRGDKVQTLERSSGDVFLEGTF